MTSHPCGATSNQSWNQFRPDRGPDDRTLIFFVGFVRWLHMMLSALRVVVVGDISDVGMWGAQAAACPRGRRALGRCPRGSAGEP